jgi:hypothetical protein
MIVFMNMCIGAEMVGIVFCKIGCMKVGLTKAGSSTRTSTSTRSVELIRGSIVVPYAKALGVWTVQQRRVLKGGSDAGSSSWSWPCNGGIGMSLTLRCKGGDALALDERLGFVLRWRRRWWRLWEGVVPEFGQGKHRTASSKSVDGL